MSNNPYSSECEWGVGRSGATGLYLGGELGGEEQLACIWVVSWEERSDWLVFGWSVGRSGATGLYLGGELAGAEMYLGGQLAGAE